MEPTSRFYFYLSYRSNLYYISTGLSIMQNVVKILLVVKKVCMWIDGECYNRTVAH